VHSGSWLLLSSHIDNVAASKLALPQISIKATQILEHYQLQSITEQIHAQAAAAMVLATPKPWNTLANPKP
jgi:ribonuclease HIII